MSTVIDIIGIGPGPLVATAAALIIWWGILTLPTVTKEDQ